MVQPLWKTVWRFLRKLKIKLPHDPAIPLLDTYPDKTVIQKDGCAPRFTIAKTWKQPKCSLGRLMLKLKLQYFGHLMLRTDSLEKILDAGKD